MGVGRREGLGRYPLSSCISIWHSPYSNAYISVFRECDIAATVLWPRRPKSGEAFLPTGCLTMIRILNQSGTFSSPYRAAVSVVLMAIACMAADFPALTAAPICPGDYNGDGICTDAADYVVWRNDPAAYGGPAGYATWRAQFGQMSFIGSGAERGSSTSVATPEPSSLLLAMMGALAASAFVRRRF